MRNIFIKLAFPLLGLFASGCFLSHERPVFVTLTPDSGPVLGGDAGMPVPDSGPVVMADAGSDAGPPIEIDAGSDAGSDAGFDAFMPFDGDAGVGRILVSSPTAYRERVRPLIAQPGYRNLFDMRRLCNSADENVLFSSLQLYRPDDTMEITNVFIVQDGRVSGRLDRFPEGNTLGTIVLDDPISIPARGCIVFDETAEIGGLRSWANHPADDGTLRSGHSAFLAWNGGCEISGFCRYVGDAVGETSGMPYELVDEEPGMVHGGMYLPVRASAVMFETPPTTATTRDSRDIEAIAFDATALGATAGFLRGTVRLQSAFEDGISSAWIEMDGRRLSADEVSIDLLSYGTFLGTMCIFTLRNERVLEVLPGRMRSDPVRVEVHVALAHADREQWVYGQIVSASLNDTSLLLVEPVTGTLTDVDVTFMFTGGPITIPGPAILRSFGPYVGQVVGGQWLTSDHSEPDHGPTSRDWNTAYMQTREYDSWTTTYVP